MSCGSVVAALSAQRPQPRVRPLPREGRRELAIVPRPGRSDLGSNVRMRAGLGDTGVIGNKSKTDAAGGTPDRPRALLDRVRRAQQIARLRAEGENLDAGLPCGRPVSQSGAGVAQRLPVLGRRGTRRPRNRR